VCDHLDGPSVGDCRQERQFRFGDGALNTIAGYEAMNIIRKGQIRWAAMNDVLGQIRFIERTFGIAA